MTRIRAISFDLDDTLWPSRPVLESAERVFNEKINELAPKLSKQYSASALRDHRLALLKQQPELRHQISEWRRLSLELALRDCGYGNDSLRIADDVFRHFIHARQQVQLYQHAEQVLHSLSERFLLVSLTNGNADFRRHPASHCFHACLKAEDIGISKPDPAAFAAVLKAADCNPDQLLHIGDHPRDDIDGAHGAGLLSIQARMPGIEREKHHGAHGHFEDWRELPQLIENVDKIR